MKRDTAGKNKKIRRTVFLIILILSLCCLVYPAAAQRWNKNKTSRLVEKYNDAVSSLTEEDILKALQDAENYNKNLRTIPYPFENNLVKEGYEDLLNINHDGIMGYLNVPVLHLELPIYHYTNDDTMHKGAGHMNGSSLPVGTESSHVVLSAHCGMPDNELFTHLERMREGDIFNISILNRTLFYEVDQVKTVLPDEMDDVNIVEGKDYVTLVTCTPFGLNTYRLLVRGRRIPEIPESNAEFIKNPSEQTNNFRDYWKMIDPRLRIFIVFILAALIIKAMIKLIRYCTQKTRRK